MYTLQRTLNDTNPLLAAGFWERWLGAHVGRVCAASGMGATTPRKKLDANVKALAMLGNL